MKTATITKWNDLTEEVTAPPAIIAALMTGRPEMLKLASATASTPEETAALYNIIRVLMETNRELQGHSQRVATEMDQLRGTLRGLNRKFLDLYHVASFTEGDNEDEG